MRNNWKANLPPFRKYKKENLLKQIEVSQFIYQLGEDACLIEKSTEVPTEDIKAGEFKQKIAFLKKCLIKYRKFTGVGRGITACQVGIKERFSVVYLGGIKFDEKISNEKLLIIINPRITRASPHRLLYPEMCMSAVPVVAPVIRPAWIEFEYLNEKGQKQIWEEKDDTDFGRIMNRVFEHEIDHMNGVINIFKVESPYQLFLESDPAFYKKAQFTIIK